MPQNLRDRLRTETRADHDIVDHAFSGVDLGSVAGMTAFVQAHEAGFGAMLDAANGQTAEELAAITAALRADLAALGGPALPSVSPLTGIHPLACAYMLAGSRLGTAVLRKSWSHSADPQVRRAGQYFGLPWDPVTWRGLCDTLQDMSGDGPEADHIVRSTKALFALFADLAGKVRSPAATKAPVFQ